MGFDADLYARAVRAELGADVAIDETWLSYRNVTDSFEFVLIGQSVAHEPRFDDYTDLGAVLARVLGESGDATAG
jgi:hypothetical protein